MTDFALNQHIRGIETRGSFGRSEHPHSFEARTRACYDGALVCDLVEFEV